MQNKYKIDIKTFAKTLTKQFENQVKYKNIQKYLQIQLQKQ